MGFSSTALFPASLPNKAWPQIKVSSFFHRDVHHHLLLARPTHILRPHSNAQNQGQSSSEYTDEGIRFFCLFPRRVIGAAVSLETQFNDLPCGNSLSALWSWSEFFFCCVSFRLFQLYLFPDNHNLGICEAHYHVHSNFIYVRPRVSLLNLRETFIPTLISIFSFHFFLPSLWQALKEFLKSVSCINRKPMLFHIRPQLGHCMWHQPHWCRVTTGNGSGPCAQPSISTALHPWIQPTEKGKYWGGKLPESSKCKTEICLMLVTYLHSIYTVLIIINNIEIISSTWEDCVHYMQISHYFIQGTSACSDFGIHWESRNQPYMDTEGWLYQ